MYPYGLIGNCQISALIDSRAAIHWFCAPNPDSEPVFGRLLDREGGSFELIPETSSTVESKCSYLDNTNIFISEISWDEGRTAIRVTDFCPRFLQMGRMYRPIAIYRKVEVLRGQPKVLVKCDPVAGWSKERAEPQRGNSHVRYTIRGEEFRVTTNFSLTHFFENRAAALSDPLYFALTWGVGVDGDIAEVADRFLKKTEEYWDTWVKHCSIPTEYQAEVIRSALTLKLHCHEESGAILAALTTSLPEIRGKERNWDYRFCWLRDASYVLSAFRNLGHFEEMEGFLKYFLSVAFQFGDEMEKLAPVYDIMQGLPDGETLHENWEGFAGSKPVRSRNQAAEHVQNDVYGEMVLALAPIYFDERFRGLRSDRLDQLLYQLGKLCAKSLGTKDAGLWEIRDGWREHTFTNLMCWAGLERMERIARKNPGSRLAKLDLRENVVRAQFIVENSTMGGVLTNGPGDTTLDASLAQAGILRFPNTALSRLTVDAILKDLGVPGEGGKADAGSFYRYLRHDDFGTPESGFVICSFWIVQALAVLGEKEQAARIMKAALNSANSLGLLSEHFDPSKKMQLGNFPQTYSHVGLINAAFALSPSWDQVI